MNFEEKIRKLYMDTFSDMTEWKRYGIYEYIYCESEIYFIRDCINKTIHIARAVSPEKAVEKISNKFVFNSNGNNQTIIGSIDNYYGKNR